MMRLVRLAARAPAAPHASAATARISGHPSHGQLVRCEHCPPPLAVQAHRFAHLGPGPWRRQDRVVPVDVFVLLSPARRNPGVGIAVSRVASGAAAAPPRLGARDGARLELARGRVGLLGSLLAPREGEGPRDVWAVRLLGGCRHLHVGQREDAGSVWLGVGQQAAKSSSGGFRPRRVGALPGEEAVLGVPSNKHRRILRFSMTSHSRRPPPTGARRTRGLPERAAAPTSHCTQMMSCLSRPEPGPCAPLRTLKGAVV